MADLWVVVKPLWSPSQNKTIQPGEVVEMSGEIVDRLLKKECIKPAISRVIEKELSDNGTNNE